MSYNIDYQGEYEEMLNTFLDIEERLNLFSFEVGEIPAWERVRLSCFREILNRTGTISQSNTTKEKSIREYLRGGYKWMKSIFIKNPFIESSSDFFFIGTGRRKLRDDGLQWDLFCDPILDEIEFDYVYTEPQYSFSHKKPAKTRNINYLDIITYTSRIQRELNIVGYTFSDKEKERLDEIESVFTSEFDISINITEMFREMINERKSRKWLYERLLNRIDPEVSVIVAGAFKHTFIEVCNERGIPVVELQHGGFGPDHMGYSFPDNRDSTSFPDYLLVFGEFWKDSVEFPIPDENVYAVGYPYLEQEKKQYENVTQNKQIIFISQDPVGEIISKFAATFAERNDAYEITYKLHPAEYTRWEDEYPWLVDADMAVIDNDNIPLYKLLAQSEIQVGVNSTVIWEGLNFGLDTYLLDAPRVERMRNLTQQANVPVISSVDEFELELNRDSKSSNVDITYFFEPNSLQNIDSVFRDIIKKNDINTNG